MVSCFECEQDGYYKTIDLGEFGEATIRTLSDYDQEEINRLAGIKIKITAKMLENVQKGKDPTFDDLDINEAQLGKMDLHKIVISLKPINGKSFANGGAGWNLKDGKDKAVAVSIENVKKLSPAIKKKLLEEIESFEKYQVKLEQNAKNLLERSDT